MIKCIGVIVSLPESVFCFGEEVSLSLHRCYLLVLISDIEWNATRGGSECSENAYRTQPVYSRDATRYSQNTAEISRNYAFAQNIP